MNVQSFIYPGRYGEKYLAALRHENKNEYILILCYIVKRTIRLKRKKVLTIPCSIDYSKAFDCMDHNKLWKILKEMGIPDPLTCLLRNLYAGQEATVRTGQGTTHWFQIGKGVHQAVYCHPAYLTYMQSTSWEMLGWMKHKLESRLLREISITSDMQMTPPLWRKQSSTKEPLDESERGEWKSWLKTQHSENEDHSIWSHHFTANRWGNSGNSEGLYFRGAPKSLQMVTAAIKLKDVYSLEEKSWPT